MKILSADWVLPISAAPIVKGGVLVSAGKILKVGLSGDLAKEYPEAAIEDFGEAAIMPGFVNCHSHLELTAMRGFLDDVEEFFYEWLIKLTKTRAELLTDEDIELAAIFGALEGAKAGVTCFGDIGRYGKAGFRALKENGLRGVVFQETEFAPLNENAPDNFATLKERYLSLKDAGTDLVEAGISPHAPYTVSAKLFELITDYALQDNIKLSIHAAESRMEEDFLRYGTGAFAEVYSRQGIAWSAPNLGAIKYLDKLGVLQARPLLVHCVNADEEDLGLISSSGSTIAHCPKSNAKFGHGIAPLEKMLNAGISVGIGSDSVASNNNCDLIEESRFAALMARNHANRNHFISAKKMLEAATLGGAKALRLDNKIGTLEKGKHADLIAISLSHVSQQPVNDIQAAILFSSSGRDVIMAMVNGEEICRNGSSMKIDEPALKKEMDSIAKKLRAPGLFQSPLQFG